jgi:hypothetical protein
LQKNVEFMQCIRYNEKDVENDKKERYGEVADV